MKYNKKMAIIAGLLAFVIVGVAASKPPEDPFQNLKVLPKKISPERMEKVMDEFTKALGVKCNFCHEQSSTDSTQWDMASDKKPEKSIARKMISMTNSINKKFFRAQTKYGDENAVIEIHCVTCHHGEPHPEMEREVK